MQKIGCRTVGSRGRAAGIGRALGRGLLIAFAAAPLAIARPALGQEPEADRATARELASEGYDALKRRDFATAEDRFQRADALVHAPTLVVDHARALVGLGRLAEAYERYQLVIREGARANAPSAWKRAVKDAEKEVREVLPKIAWLTVTVRGVSEPRVWIDGREVPADELGKRRPADPGVRSVATRAPGFLPKEGSVTLSAGAEASLEVELEPIPPEAPPPPRRRAPAPAPAPVERPSPDRTWIYVAFGAGAAGLVTGTVTGILALGVRRDIDTECPGLVCSPTTTAQRAHFESQRDKYHLLGTVSGIGFTVGLAGAAAGTALLVMQSKDTPDAATAQPEIVPYVGLGSVGVSGKF